MEIELDLTYKQTVAFDYLMDDTTSEVLFGGSAGGGKSFLGCAWLIVMCFKYPGTRWLMGRAKLKALKDTTLNTFFDIASMWGINKEFKYNGQDSIITFKNGSQIYLKDLFRYPSDPNFDSLGSLEITGAFIDEVNQVTEKAKNVVNSRIRYKNAHYNIPEKIFMSCNPAKNWVYDEFYKKDKEGKLEYYKKFIPALVTDNPNIAPSYIKQLEKLDEVSKKRLLYGQWEYEDVDALMDYDSVIDIFKPYQLEIPKDKKNNDFFVSVDVARKGKDKAVILVWYKLNIIDSITLDISLTDEIVLMVNDIKKEYKIPSRNVVIDGDGVGGGVVDNLKGSVDFVNNSKALKGENYQNLKTQCYFKLAELVNGNEVSIFKFSIEEKEKIIQELSSIKRKNIDKDGKLQIITKDEIKALIGRSPDYSDAMMMRMYYEVFRQVSDHTGVYKFNI